LNHLSDAMWCDVDRVSRGTHAECYEEHPDRTSNVAEKVPAAIEFTKESFMWPSVAASVYRSISERQVSELLLEISHASVRSVESSERIQTGFFEAMSAVLGLSSKAKDKVSFEKYMKTISKSRTLNKASELIDGLISNDLLFKDVDKRMVLKDLSEVFDDMSAEQVELSGNMLQDTLKGILVGYAASDIFDDFTPSQEQQFERATKRSSSLK